MAIALLAGPPCARAGGRLSVEQLVERADVIVRLRIEIGRQPAARVRGILRGELGNGLPPFARLAGVCIPDQRRLEDWISRSDYF
jgi:hypothetical protein